MDRHPSPSARRAGPGAPLGPMLARSLKGLGPRADPKTMDEDIKRALVKSGAKLGIGLGLLAAMIGIRIVTVTPRGIESEIAELDHLEQTAETETKAPATASPATSAPAMESDSVVGRLSATLREGLPNSDPGAREGDRLVSCRLATGTHYMRADDCATRGGESTIFEAKP